MTNDISTQKGTLAAVTATPCRDLAFAARVILKAIRHRLTESQPAGMNQALRQMLATGHVIIADYDKVMIFDKLPGRHELFMQLRSRDHAYDGGETEHFLSLTTDVANSAFMDPAAKAMACLGPTDIGFLPQTGHGLGGESPIRKLAPLTMADLIRDPAIQFAAGHNDLRAWRRAATLWGDARCPALGLEHDLVEDMLQRPDDEVAMRLRQALGAEPAPAAA